MTKREYQTPAAARKLVGQLSLDTMLSNLNPIDLAVFTAGAYAGWNGLTPTTAMFNIVKGVGSAIDSVSSAAASAVQKAATDTNVQVAAFINPLFAGPAFLGSLIGHAAEPAQQTQAAPAQTPQQKLTQQLMNSYQFSMAMVGGVEAIMVTRPGFAPALLQMGQSVLGDLKSGGMAAIAGLL